MLRFFRINDPYRLALIFVILLLIRIAWGVYGLPLSSPELKWMILGQWLSEGHLMYAETFDHTGPLAVAVYKVLGFLFGASRGVHLVMSTLLIMVQGGIFNNLLLKNKVYDENTYIPAFIYVVLMSGVPDFFAFSPALMSITFVLLALNNIFRRIDNQITDELFLYSGLYLGLSAAFYLPSIIYFPMFLLSFVAFSTAVPRRLVLLVYGVMLIFLVIWSYFFWYNITGHFLESYLLTSLTKPKIHYLSYGDFFRLGVVIGVVMLISLSALFTSRYTNFQQKMQQVMILFFLAGIGVVLLSPELSGSEMIGFVPPVAFFMTYYVLNMRRRRLAYLLSDILLIGVLIYPAIRLREIDAEKLIVEKQTSVVSDKSLMILGDDLSLYYGNELASPFLDPYLGKKRLQDLNYYREASRLYEVIQDSDPEIIVDEWKAMPQILAVFPMLKKKYQTTDGSIYYRISN